MFCGLKVSLLGLRHTAQQQACFEFSKSMAKSIINENVSASSPQFACVNSFIPFMGHSCVTT